MLTIPDGIKTLLKSRVMVGVNRPTAEVIVAGQPVTTGELIDPTNWSTWQQQGAADWMQSYGNCAQNIEGTPLIVYRPGDSSTVKIAFGTNWPAILSGTEDFAFASALTITTAKYRAICRVSLVGEELFLAICWWNATTNKAILEFWKDATGIGSAFAYVSTIHGDVAWNYFYDGVNTPGVDDPTSATLTWNMISEIKKLANGTLVILANEPNWAYEYIVACYSSDGGATWTVGARSTYMYGRLFNSGIIEFDDGSYGVIVTRADGTSSVYYWINNGATLNIIATSNWRALINNNFVQGASWTRTGANIYMACYDANQPVQCSVLYYIGTLPATAALCADGANWEIINQTGSYRLANKHLSFCGEYIVLSVDTTNSSENSGILTIAGCVGERVHIPIKSITVDRSKGSASQTTVVIDNKNGLYSPDSTGEWHKILWLNKTITITMGYGAEQETVFTGLIDEIMETNYPAELTVVARDLAKRALDQQPQATVGEATVYALLYESKTPEEIFAELALLAGWAAGDIHVGVSGVTISSIQFGHESIADCFQRLCELVCWEWFVDEAGEIYFQASTDPAATVYEFVEGVDIFSISYRISDIDLYRNIVVWTSDEDGLAVKASTVWSAADYNNLLPYKTLIIPASDLVTDAAGCAAIAAAEANAITPKVREVNFVAVGNPYLQIGDVVKVTESTTHASELYRIMELMHQMEAAAEGVPVFSTSIRCYHYGPAA